jgi:hypothetical protein
MSTQKSSEDRGASMRLQLPSAFALNRALPAWWRDSSLSLQYSTLNSAAFADFWSDFLPTKRSDETIIVHQQLRAYES